MRSGYTVQQLGSQASSCYSGHFIWSGQGTFLSPTDFNFFSHAPWDTISKLLKSSDQKLFLGKERSNICYGERFSSSVWSARANRKVSVLIDFWGSREIFLESANHFSSCVNLSYLLVLPCWCFLVCITIEMCRLWNEIINVFVEEPSVSFDDASTREAIECVRWKLWTLRRCHRPVALQKKVGYRYLADCIHNIAVQGDFGYYP